MSVDAVGIMVILGLASGLSMVSAFMFFFAMMPPYDAPKWKPSSYDPMPMLIGRGAGKARRKRASEIEEAPRAA